MPEVIEAKSYADLLRLHLNNKIVESVSIDNGRYKKKGPFTGYSILKKILPCKVTNVCSKGKMIYIEFDKEYWLVSKLGLSGGWCWKSFKSDKYVFPSIFDVYSKYEPKAKTDRYTENLLKHLNFKISTKSGALYYHDVLSYGTLELVDKNKLDIILNKLGPDIMDKHTTFNVWYDRITLNKNLNKYICNVLVDQSVISGIGNYLRADILYASKIYPFKLVANLTKRQLRTIYNCSKMLTWGIYDNNRGIKLGWTNSKSMIPSNYDRLFLIYQQSTDIYGNPVYTVQNVNAGQKRTVYYVPKIQKK